jgi:hypothetical protein
METMDFNFELFEGVKGKFTPVVSISKPGYISFSSGSQHRFNLSDYSSAQLFFDKNQQTIAIKLFREAAEKRFNLTQRKDNKGSFIACRSFIAAYQLEAIFGRKFTPEEIDHQELGKLMLIDLKKPKN